jgi:predicted ATP-binding protein involved in virulence
MKLTKIEIKGLFDLFDYDIPLTNEENLLIITGPNGFGKTMILNIIFSFFNKRFFFFQKLIFKEISISIDNDVVIQIQKTKEKRTNVVNFRFTNNGEEIEKISYSNKTEKDMEHYLSFIPQIRRYDEHKWIDRRTDRVLDFDEIIEIYSDELPEEHMNNAFMVHTKNNKINEIFALLKVHLIKEQRLLKRVQADRNFFSERSNNIYTTDTIREYAKELKMVIAQNLQQSFIKSQELDSSFPRRLLNETGNLTKEDFNKRFETLRDKQNKLKKYGLSTSQQEVPSYNKKNANVLLVYLKDSEEKLEVFDTIVSKLDIFTDILNERRFTYKSIRIDKEKGFVFLTVNGKELSLTDLSSGEQHEVVLLYELIFKTNPNTLVLIDEPEISLHVTWQKEFLNDLLRILALQKMQVIVATHSPQIINERWDLVFNLEAQKMQ